MQELMKQIDEDMLKIKRPELQAQLDAMVAEGALLEVQVERLGEEPFYALREDFEAFERKRRKKRMHILSPFDNLIIQRHRPLDLFDFDYKLECYVPEPKRVVGYYTLPVLFGERFVAQIDAKADRKRKVFEIRNFVVEDARERNIWQAKLETKLGIYAQFNGCEQVDWGR